MRGGRTRYYLGSDSHCNEDSQCHVDYVSLSMAMFLRTEAGCVGFVECTKLTEGNCDSENNP